MRQLQNLKRTCKSCKKEYTPKVQAQPRCPDCIFAEQKKNLCVYAKKTLVNRSNKPQKPLKNKVDSEQVKINAIVRKRDAGKPCISCGAENVELQAGHYYARSQCESLRYDLSNIHGQCARCNGEMTANKQVPENYRKNLLVRIGTEEVKRLDEAKRNAGRYS